MNWHKRGGNKHIAHSTRYEHQLSKLQRAVLTTTLHYMVVHLRSSRVQLVGQEIQYQHQHDPLQETNIGDATIPITSTLKFYKKVKVENCYAYLSPMKRVLLLLPLAIWLLILTASDVTKRDTIDTTFSYRDGGGEAEKYAKGNPPSKNDAQKQKTKPPSSLSAAQMANNHLRDRGVLLRTKEHPVHAKNFDENGRDYMPASFVHASMRAPNVIYRQWFKWSYDEAKVAYLIASKFERHLPISDLPNKADCRAYYPKDSWSKSRDHKIFNNPVGTSCKPHQKKTSSSGKLYNVTNRYAADVCKIIID